MSDLQPRQLLLIRHSMVEVIPSVPAREWRLSDEGRRRCELLAQRVAAYEPTLLASSVEPKARATAELIGACLGLAVESADGLHEHERDTVGYLGRAQFEAAVADFFARPDEQVLGGETAAQALGRFGGAVDTLLASQPNGNVAIVSHGTVISLFVAARAGIDPLPFWRGLAVPDLVVLGLPTYHLLSSDGASSTAGAPA